MKSQIWICLLAAFSIIQGLNSANAAGSATLPIKAPYEVSLASTVGYDDNLYLVNNGGLKDRGSMLYAVSAKIAAKTDHGVSVSYAPTITRFSDESKEDHVKHVLSSAWTKKVDNLSLNTVTDLTFVDGDGSGVDYGPYGSAFSTVAPRERRDQWQNKSDLALRYDAAAGFVRGVGKLQYWDMRTAAVGAANYVDRYDIQGGVDFGRSFRKDGPEYYLGYRSGYQFQDNDYNPATRKNASNHYARYLVGVEGKLRPGLKLNAQAGWAVHNYAESELIYPGTQCEEGLYTDIAVTWSANLSDEFQFKTTRCRTFSTVSSSSVLASLYQLAWQHSYSKKWRSVLTGRVAEAEYSPAARDDLDYSVVLVVTYDFNPRVSGAFTASKDLGLNNHNAISGVTEKNREFERTFASFTLSWKI